MSQENLSPIAQSIIDGKTINDKTIKGKTIEGNYSPQDLAQEIAQIQAHKQKLEKPGDIQTQLIDFLLKWLFVLQEELKPGKDLQVKLHLGKARLKDFPLLIQKNYKRLYHRYVLWGYWLFNLVLGLFLVFGVIYGKTWLGLLQIYSFLIVPIYLLLGFLGVKFLAENVFGEIDPKVKSRIRQVPRIVIKTQLADATLFELNVSHHYIRKTSIKDKFYKALGTTKTKRKRKTKTVVTLKLGFAKKVYPLSETDFAQRFRYLLRMGDAKIAKMKLKTSDKRHMVIYQDVAGKEGKVPPSVDFDRTLKLVTIGGYRRLLQGLPENYWWDDLTRIEGLMEEVGETFNKNGIYTFQQLMTLEVRDFADEETFNCYRLGEWYFRNRLDGWQTKAQELLLAQGEDLSRIEGVGGVLLEKLHESGIYTFQKLIDLTKKEKLTLIEEWEVSEEKVTYWQKQAKELVK